VVRHARRPSLRTPRALLLAPLSSLIAPLLTGIARIGGRGL